MCSDAVEGDSAADPVASWASRTATRVSNGTPGTTLVTAGSGWTSTSEGMKYDDWPVARLIEREISRPLLLTRYRRKVARPDRVTVFWARDSWQYSARRRIKEANLAPTPIALDRLDGQGWADALRGARECLDPRRQHRGRRKVPVTLLPSKRRPRERQVEMDVSPHLKIRMPLAEITPRAMWEGRNNLEGVYGFVAEQSRP